MQLVVHSCNPITFDCFCLPDFTALSFHFHAACSARAILAIHICFANEIYIVLQCHLFCTFIMFAIIFVLLVTLQVVRTSLMSCLLKTLKHNIDHPRPIKVLFETGNIYIFLVSVSNVVSHLKISTKKKQKKVTFLLLSVTLFVGTILFLLA